MLLLVKITNYYFLTDLHLILKIFKFEYQMVNLTFESHPHQLLSSIISKLWHYDLLWSAFSMIIDCYFLGLQSYLGSYSRSEEFLFGNIGNFLIKEILIFNEKLSTEIYDAENFSWYFQT